MESTFGLTLKRSRKFPGTKGRRPDLKAKRVGGAEARAEIRAKRSAADQVADLDCRLGKGLGAASERERLAAAARKEGRVRREAEAAWKPTLGEIVFARSRA